MEKQLSFQQIVLITDGYSNVGLSPIEAAMTAKRRGIVVHVIGIADENEEIKGRNEIEAIAKAGGGFQQIVELDHVAKTMELFTKKTMNTTLQHVVHQQLNQILQGKTLQTLPPDERIQVSKLIDDLSEYSHLDILLLIDRSASMTRKMDKLKEAIYDFQLSIHSRAGSSEVAIGLFPGVSNVMDIVLPWTTQTIEMNRIISKLISKGNTPTGPALLEGLDYIIRKDFTKNQRGALDEFII